MPETIDEIKKYIGPFSGPQMDQIFYEILNYTSERYAKGTANSLPVAPGTPGYQDNSLYYKNQAQTAAAGATSSANAAANSETAAAASAETAQQAAESTAGSTEAAAASAAAAAQSASEAATSAEAASIALKLMPTINISGDIASFSDGGDDVPVVNLKTNLDIVQPLHGQANPYPAGGGANKWDEDWEAGGIAQSTGENTSVADAIRSKGYIPITENTSYYMAMPSAVRAYLRFYDSSKVYLGSATAIQNIAPSAFTTPTGASFMRFYCTESTYGNNIAVNLPATVTTYSPYSNICPIYPVTEAEVYRNGVNQWDEEWRNGRYEDGVFIANSNYVANKNPIRVSPNTSYYFILNSSTQAGRDLSFYDADGNYLSKQSYYANTVFTTPANAQYMNFNMGGAYGTAYVNNISINYPSTDTAYHSGTGNQQHLVNIGINQWDEETEQGYIGNDGTLGSDASSIRSANYCPCIGGTQYCVVAPASRAIHWYDKDKTHLSYDGIGAPSTVVTAPANAAYFKLSAYLQGYPYGNNMSVNFPARFTDYHEYTGHTVYGGELDITTGVLTAKFKRIALDGTENWNGTDGAANYQIADSYFLDGRVQGVSKRIAGYCSHLQSELASGHICIDSSALSPNSSTGNHLDANGMQETVWGQTFPTLASWKSYLAAQAAAGTPVTIIMELATPLTIQLDPTEVRTLLGDNTIFSDAGTIDLTYKADLGLYIDEHVAELQALILDH